MDEILTRDLSNHVYYPPKISYKSDNIFIGFRNLKNLSGFFFATVNSGGANGGGGCGDGSGGCRSGGDGHGLSYEHNLIAPPAINAIWLTVAKKKPGQILEVAKTYEDII